MSDRTNIEWADSTFNPWMGCTKVSPACDHCYAERDTGRFGRVEWGAGKPRVRTSAANWRKPLQWNRALFLQCVACGWRGEDGALTEPQRVCPACSSNTFEAARRRVFCASLADVFDNEVDIQWRRSLLKLIAETPNLDWLILTKRVGNVMPMLNAVAENPRPGSHVGDLLAHHWRNGTPPANAWLGATICNQAEADRDIPKLLATPAAVRFLSIEPMLGAIDLLPWLDPTGACCMREMGCCEGCPAAAELIHGPTTVYAEDGSGFVSPEIDWVIAGGESGPQARPMHPEWVRGLRDQCAEYSVPFLFKQWGEWAPRAGKIHGSGTDFQSLDPQCTQWPQVIRLGEHGKNTRHIENCTPDKGEEVFMQRVGKKAAGRMLDGKTHGGFPQAAAA